MSADIAQSLGWRLYLSIVPPGVTFERCTQEALEWIGTGESIYRAEFSEWIKDLKA